MTVGIIKSNSLSQHLDKSKNNTDHLSNQYSQTRLQDKTNLVGEQGPDAAEECQLLLQRVTTLLRHIHDVQNSGSQVSQSCDGLHLDGVSLLQGVVQDARSVHHLDA